MTCQLSLDQLSKIIDATHVQLSDSIATKRVTGVNTDTRTLGQDEVFVALEGENFNGHDFLEEAIAKGAIALIINTHSSVTLSSNIPLFKVEDTLKAYQKIGRWWRDQYSIPVVGITGSVGKTSMKELIASVLSTTGKVLKTQANYNNEIGVPKTLLALESDHDYAVVEMAMRGMGEIAVLTEIARPTVGVITNVGTAHIGRLGSEEAIAMAKCELLATMPSNSVAVLNHDCPRLLETAARVWQGEMVTYGLEGGEIRGELLDSQRMKVEGQVFPLPLPGRHQALNYLGALTVAKVLGIDWSPLTEGIAVTLPSGRSQRHLLPNDILILDETYNAGLESMIAALELLKDTPGKRHIAILGTMKELGKQSAQLHQRVGKKAKELNLDALLVLVDDPEAEAIAAGSLGVPTTCLKTHSEIVQRLEDLIQPGDRLLFKASNSVGLNHVVQQVIHRFKD